MEDRNLIATALAQWANYIETGAVYLSANDVIAAKQHVKVKALTQDQRKLVIRLRDLAIQYQGLPTLDENR